MIINFHRDTKGKITGFDASEGRVYSLSFRRRK
jgi:hypothetical protein